MSEEIKTPIPAEGGHFYDRETGAPVYEVPCTSKEGNRPTNLTDARKLDLVPSVTKILRDCVRAPGLERYKEDQLAMACLTLPRVAGEFLDAFLVRARDDAKAHAEQAAERGTALHTAIEKMIHGWIDPEWETHLLKISDTLHQIGIDLRSGEAEHSFATQLGGNWFGGKVDYHTRGECVICDFKSKEKIESAKRLAWDEHLLQLSAYGYGLFSIISSTKAIKLQPYRALNVFVGVSDCEVRVIEHSPQELEHALSMWSDILSFWHKKNRFGRYAN